jgi:N-acyl homoserine lactone hydrolase
MPSIDVLTLARITGVPEFHPEHDTFRPFPVHGFLVHHPDGPIIVDTGIGVDNGVIDSMYPHESVSLVDELHRFGVDERDVQLIVNSHLHFDHCGQNHALACPVMVQEAEVTAAHQPHYTVDEWAAVPAHRLRLVDGDAHVCDGVRIIHTPGHTPGHQAVVIGATDDVVVIAAQCIFRREAWLGQVESANLHGPEWQADAVRSVARLRALRPTRVFLSHDAAIETSIG